MKKRNDESLEWTLIRRSFAGELSGEEQRQLEAWLEASPDHRAFYDRVSGFDRSEGIPGLSEETCKRDLDRYVENLRQYKRKSSRRRLVLFTRYAAVLLVMLSVGLYFWYANRPQEGITGDALALAVHGKVQPILITGNGTRVNLAEQGELLREISGGSVSSEKNGIVYTGTSTQSQKTELHTLIIPRGESTGWSLPTVPWFG